MESTACVARKDDSGTRGGGHVEHTANHSPVCSCMQLEALLRLLSHHASQNFGEQQRPDFTDAISELGR